MKIEMANSSVTMVIIAFVVIVVLYFLYDDQQMQNQLLVEQNTLLGKTLMLLTDEPETLANLDVEPRIRISGFQTSKSE